MSRSRRYTPIIRCGKSDKWWRRSYNRKLRRANKVRLQKQPEDFLPKLVREVSNVWDSNRDDQRWFGHFKYGHKKYYWFWWHMWHWVDKGEKPVSDLVTEARNELKETYKQWMRK